MLTACQSGSLSARRAWIEISGVDFAEDWLNAVALRKESVDRNVFGFGAKLVHSLSLSARRAWIEIAYPLGPQATYPSRSPQGERG